MAKIILLDDSKIILILIAEILEGQGFSDIIKVQNSAELFKSIKDTLPNLVIIDINLLADSGYDVCKRIKTEYGEKIKVILITSTDCFVNREMFDESMADDIVIKNSKFTNLIESVNSVLKK